MKILDGNAWVGHFPYRPLPFTTLEGLLREWDRQKISGGVVQSLGAVWYRNVHNGNVELHRQIKGHASRAFMFGTVNPAYVGWEDDLAQCVQEFGVRGINLHPHYHGYGWDHPQMVPLIARLRHHGLPVALTLRFEDARQRHALDRVPELEAWEIAEFIRRFPGLRILVHNATDAVACRREIQGRAPGAPSPVFTNAFLWGDPEGRDRALVAEAGPGALALGTHLPFRVAKSALLKLSLLDRPAKEQAGFTSGNLEAVLRRRRT